jgi:hypothetical protein
MTRRSAPAAPPLSHSVPLRHPPDAEIEAAPSHQISKPCRPGRRTSIAATGGSPKLLTLQNETFHGARGRLPPLETPPAPSQPRRHRKPQRPNGPDPRRPSSPLRTKTCSGASPTQGKGPTAGRAPPSPATTAAVPSCEPRSTQNYRPHAHQSELVRKYLFAWAYCVLHVNCIHKLCNLLSYIPTYLHVIRNYIHVLH